MNENHKNKFKTPDDYFESFNERLLDKISKENTMIPASDGFKAPDDYFDSLPKTLAKKVAPKVVSLQRYQKYYWVAASIAAIFILTLVLNQKKVDGTNIGFEDLASAELDAYLEDNQMDLTAYDLAEVISIENIMVSDMTQADEGLEGALILEYLEEQVDEIEDLNLNYEELE